MTQTNFLDIVKARGYFHQCTDEAALHALFAKGPVTAYIGFDCTASTVHVGTLIQIMLIRLLQQTGNKPIVLLGGATTKVGDPSGKDETRQLRTEDEIKQNMAGIKSVFEQFDVTFGDGPSDAVLVNNDDWLGGVKYIEFLRDVGRHFSVNRMLSMESVKMRLEREQELSFLEFNYMVLQAYDFVKLYDDYGCRVQIGGSDQWGNIVMGTDLNRRLKAAAGQAENVEPLFGLTTPLITTASGAKMGKTAAGAVWLTAKDLPAYDYWQFWRNTEDADVGRFLKLFTDLPLAEIERLEELEGADINQAKVVLANEATKICHGEAAAKEAEETARKVFEQGGIGESLPVVELPQGELDAGVPAFKLFQLAGLTASGGETRRLIKQGGAKVNDEKITDAESLIGSANLNGDGVIKLSAGKKKHALVKVA